VKASAADSSSGGTEVRLEYAGLARGEDPALGAAVDDLATGHARLLDADLSDPNTRK